MPAQTAVQARPLADMTSTLPRAQTPSCVDCEHIFPPSGISTSEAFHLAMVTVEECAGRESHMDEGEDEAGYDAAQQATTNAWKELAAVVDAWTAQRVAAAIKIY